MEANGNIAVVPRVVREVNVLGVPHVGGQVGECFYRGKGSRGVWAFEDTDIYRPRGTLDAEAHLQGEVAKGVDVQVGEYGCGIAGVVVVGV